MSVYELIYVTLQQFKQNNIITDETKDAERKLYALR